MELDRQVARPRKIAHAGGLAEASSGTPLYEGDFYSNEFIADPYPHYAAMRALGPVIYMTELGNYAITRYAEVRETLRNHAVFSSAKGVAADQAGCEFLRGANGNVLSSDPPEHDVLRGLVAAPLLPGALEALRGRIEEEAERLVGRLLLRDQFDGIADLAHHLPLTIVTELVGLPDRGRENMLHWAASTFDLIGIQNERGRAALGTLKEMRQYLATEAVPGRLKPGSWIGRLYDLADSGHISSEMCPLLMRDYIGPSLDTTIAATGQLLFQLGRNPAQWNLIRRDPSLIPGAVNEAVRLGSPIRTFSRTLTQDIVLNGHSLPAGARVMVLFASANRDERRFPDPDRFDPTRPGTLHVGFGHGIHQCVGMHLARLEMESLLKAMAGRVTAFEVGEPELVVNNTIHGFAKLPMRLVPAAADQVAVRHLPPSPVPRLYPVWRDVRIVDRRTEAEGIVSFKLEAANGGELPPFEAGAHLDVEVSPGLIRQYSLCNPPAESSRRYRIAVLREVTSRGGSHGIHDVWQLGRVVRVSRPRNTFPLDEGSRRTVLVGGGVGITPMLAMAYRLQELGRDFVLHHCVRTTAKAAFGDEIHSSAFGQSYHLHVSSGTLGQRFSARDALGATGPGTRIYCCGPQGFMDMVASNAADLGWPAQQLHLERFGAALGGANVPFTVVAHRSGLKIPVPAHRTILDALTEAGIDVPSSCSAGVCGTCLTDVVCGLPDHRDMVQTADEKSSNRRVAVCCSRSLGETLVLDI